MIKKTIAGLLAFSCMLLAEEDCCETFVLPGDPIDPCCIPAGYPLPASINPCCSWDVYASGDFLYLAASMEVQSPTAQRFTFVDGINFQIDRRTENFNQNSEYRPGFRVSLGLDLDSVIIDTSYMRYHSRTTSHFGTQTNEGLSLVGAAGSILDSSLLTGQPVLFSNIRSIRHINMDRVLVEVQKPVYMGKQIVMDLGYGLLVYWIEQKWNFDCVALPNPPAVVPAIRTSDGFATADHKSWAIGPALSFKAIGLLPWNFKAIFNINLSAQYATLYKGTTTTSFPDAPLSTNNTTIKREKVAYSQAVQSAEIGLGWGTYFGCDRYYINLYATYNFFSHYLIAYGLPYSATTVDFFFQSYSLHGIAIGGRFDF